ncbi:MAG: penicillin acylase family protein [Gemmatimonadales bacterium]
MAIVAWRSAYRQMAVRSLVFTASFAATGPDPLLAQAPATSQAVSPARIGPSPDRFRAQIQTTSYGVPHVKAADVAGAGFGLGYAFAKTDLCTVADRWVTVRGERSRYFGPEGVRDGRQQVTNLQSDFFWKRILDLDVIGRDLRQPPPLGPTPVVRDLVRGYVAGYNHYLAQTGVANLPDRRCRGKAWVRPITEEDVYLRALHWNMVTSARWVGPIVDAVAPGSGSASSGSDGAPAARPQSRAPADPGPMSNLLALGKDATDNGRGMLFANPHWRWHEPERWFEAQLTVPGVMDVYGGMLEGLPIVMFGFNRQVAWSHTASVPKRETVYQLRLAPGSPTSYQYDGAVRAMTPRTVTVDVRLDDGRLTKQSHTFWETHFGPIVADANYVWSPTTAYAVRSVTMSFRWLNQQLGMMLARSAAELDEAGRTYLAIGWLNTAAADSAGHVIYADRSAVPFVTDAFRDQCLTSELGKRIFAQQQLSVLDGWRKECEWGVDPDAPVPGIFGPKHLPQLARTDWVMNSNDSHWANNPAQPLEGFAGIIGDERTPRSLRTRNGLVKLERRLSSTDGHPGNRFTLGQLETITMDNRVYSGEIWRDSVVALCRALPVQKGIPEACGVLARWDLTDDLDSPGSVLWRRFMENITSAAKPDAEYFTIPFDPSRPAHTPRGLNTANPQVTRALTAAITDLRDSGVPLDAKLRQYQYEERSGKRIPIHGGPAPTGQYNLIITQSGWVPGKGWNTVMHASSYILWMQFTDRGPVGRSVLAPSQSDNPDSPHHADQTVLFSEKKSKPVLFDDAAIRADPNLTVIDLCRTAKGGACR